MPEPGQTQILPFSALAAPVKIANKNSAVVICANFARRFGSHILIGGMASDRFTISVVDKAGGAQAPASLFFGSCEAPWSEKGAYKFLAVIATDARELIINFCWPQFCKEFLLGGDIGGDISGVGAYISKSDFWPVLRLFEPFSLAWHQFLANLPAELINEAADTGISLAEQETIGRLKEIFAVFDPSGWQGSIDGFDSMRVTGWAKKADSPKSQAMDIYLNDKCIHKDFPASEYRADVRAAGIGTGKYGFNVLTPSAGREGDIQAFSLRDPETGSVFAFQFFQYPFGELEYRANVEAAVPQIRGWATTPDQLERIFDIDIYIDGAFYATTRNDKPREDLLKKGEGAGIGGFSIDAPTALLPAGQHSIRLEFCGGRKSSEFILDLPSGNVQNLAKFIEADKAGTGKDALAAKGSGQYPAREPAPIADLSILDKPATIIIPFYNDPCLEECLARLFEYTPENVPVILVDDCSPDIHAEDVLAKFSPSHKVTLLKNPRNRGFSATVNRGMVAAGDTDVILLNQDARVTPGWYRSLLLTAASHPWVGTVTPMSDRAGAFSAPKRGNYNPLPPACTEAGFARAFRRSSFGLRPSVPSGHGFCMYIKRACLDQIGMIDAETFNSLYGDENDFCMRALREGWLHLVDDRTYVFHDRPVVFAPERAELMERGVGIIHERYPEYGNAIEVFRKGKKLNYARFAAKLASEHWRQLEKPRLLFVMAVSDGGTPQTNLDLMREFQDNAQCYLLGCDTRVMRLHVMENGALRQLFEHELDEQLEPFSHISADYDAVVAGWLYDLDIDIIHIRQLMWHSLNLIPIAKKLGCKVIFSLHDFYAVSPNLNLIDDAGVFRGDDYVEQSSVYRVNIWHRSGRGEPPVHDVSFRQFWKKRSQKYLKQCDALVTTSEATRAIILEELPELDEERLFVIPHGRNFRSMRNARAHLEPWQTIRLLAPGDINYHKGCSIIQALADYDRKHHDRLEFHILGKWHGEQDAKIRNHGPYERDEFASIAAEIAPHAGVMFSIWSETWCHTLTEMWASSIPVLTLDFGTQAARIRNSGAGWILPYTDIPELYERIFAIMDNQEEQQRASQAIGKWQTGAAIANNTRLMAARYYDVYANLLNGWPDKRVPKRKLTAVCTRASLGTSHLRVIEPAQNDFRRNSTYLFCNGEQLRAYAEAGIPDSAIIQRNLLAKALVKPTLDLLQQQNIPYIYEMDDDLFNIPPDKDPGLWYHSYRPHMKMLMTNAAKFTVSTTELEKRYSRECNNVAFIQSKLGKRFWGMQPKPRRHDREIRALYHGTPTHAEDLLMILPALQQVADRHPEFRLALLRVNEGMEGIVNANPFMEVVPLENWQMPYPAFSRYLHEVATKIDFGIAPLLDSYFNRGKSFNKVIEYGALGLTTIASNVVPYSELSGFPHLLLCDNNIEDWIKGLEKMLAYGRQNRRNGMEAMGHVVERFVLHKRDYKEYDRLVCGQQ